jgi:hypothetical protein
MERLIDAPRRDELLQTPILTCTLVGSFRYMDMFNQTIDQLTQHNVRVLSPDKGKVIGQDNGFKVLDIDQNLPPLEAESGFLSNLLKSDLGLIINPKPTADSVGGYLGATSVTEIEIASHYGVPFVSIEQTDPTLDPNSASWKRFCNHFSPCSINTLIERLHNPLDSLHQLRTQNFRVGHQYPEIEELTLQVLSADWIKYRGLGYVVDRTIDWLNRNESHLSEH